MPKITENCLNWHYLGRCRSYVWRAVTLCFGYVPKHVWSEGTFTQILNSQQCWKMAFWEKIQNIFTESSWDLKISMHYAVYLYTRVHSSKRSYPCEGSWSALSTPTFNQTVMFLIMSDTVCKYVLTTQWTHLQKIK